MYLYPPIPKAYQIMVRISIYSQLPINFEVLVIKGEGQSFTHSCYSIQSTEASLHEIKAKES